MIHALFLASGSQQTQQAVTSLQLHANQGIIGDRYYDQIAENNITFIEYENIAVINEVYQQNYSIEVSRRNVITKNVSLNHLVGRQFQIGEVHFIGTELCQPCRLISEQLANDTITPKQIMTSMLNKGGIRAKILNNGIINIGESIQINE